MEYLSIAKADIPKLLAAAADDFAVYAPVRGLEGPEFARYGGGEILLDFQNATLSPKGVFFPQTETICEFDFDAVENIPMPDEKILVFGSRPCDAQSLTYLDKNFSDYNKGYEDPYFVRRREGAVMISLACNEPCSTCFCSSVGGGPANEAGSDILAVDLGDELLLKTVTEKGESFMAARRSDAGEVLKESENGGDTAAELRKKAEEKMKPLEFEKEALKTVLDGSFNDGEWRKLTQNCIGCGACTYLCPTCYCFDISDEQRQYKGKRIRTWDSCQYGKFTMHASGHNPRTDKTQRLRQRFMHKFAYTVETTGDIFCVGCGRCIIHCPVNLDIREVVSTFAKKQS